MQWMYIIINVEEEERGLGSGWVVVGGDLYKVVTSGVVQAEILPKRINGQSNWGKADFV